MTALGGVAGDAPAAPPGHTLPRDSFFRRAGKWARGHEEHGWRWAALVAVYLPLAALVFAVSVLAVKAWPAIKVNGLSFLYGKNWTYGNGYGQTVYTHGVAHAEGAQFGAWPIILGTLQSSLIAILVAVPLSIGAAFALTERIPGWISRPLGFAIEILAGIPSVVIGLWGLLTFGPWMATHIYPIMANIAGHLPNVWPFNYFRGPTGTGEGLLSAGLVLAMMIIPIIASTTRDLFVQVPTLPKEGGEALGMTHWEVANRITLPWVRSGIIGASVLGLGRALGETIAVAMVGGASLHIAPNIYQPFGTIAATILTQLDGAQADGTGFAVATLAELALVLALISVGVNLIARGIVSRTSRLGGPVGRGA